MENNVVLNIDSPNDRVIDCYLSPLENEKNNNDGNNINNNSSSSNTTKTTTTNSHNMEDEEYDSFDSSENISTKNDKNKRLTINTNVNYQNDPRTNSSILTSNRIMRGFIKDKDKTIGDLLEQANEIKNSYKPGIFEEIINGPRGPSVRLHRYNLIVGFLKLLIILGITAGIILLTVIMLCITINVGYVCVQIDDVNSFVQLVFFAFYFDALKYIIKSLWRTYLRALHTVLDSKFGSSIDDMFIKRVLGYLFSLKIAQWTLPDKYKSHPKDWYEKVNLTIFVIFLFICFIPVILVAYFFGYWKLMGLIWLMYVCGGAMIIIGLNFFSRIILFIKFFRRLDDFYYNAPFFVDLEERIDNQTSYLRLTYCSTNGLEGGENPFNYVLDILIHMIVSIGVAAFIFGSFDPDAYKITAIVVSLVIILPIRFRKSIHKLLVKMHILSKEKMNLNDERNKNRINAEMDVAHKAYLKSPQILSARGNGNVFNFDFVDNNKNIKGVNSPVSQNSFMRNVNRNHSFSDSSSHTNLSFTNRSGSYSASSSTTANINSGRSKSISSSKKSSRNQKHNPHILLKNSPISSEIPNTNTSSSLFDDLENDDSFYYLLKSNKSYVRRKALLKWDIKTLISWKGCLTVFFSRCVKYIIGITFMAFLNYYRYSVNSDEETTTNNLYKDIFTHIIFIFILMGQDVLYLIPMNVKLFSMKSREILFVILLVLELILVVGMRIIITNGYIPMAFIVLAYANFKVYPDPRYSWDDEKINRKTFFDLFKPEFNLRSDISYKHYGKTNGFRFKKHGKKLASKFHRHGNKLRKGESLESPVTPVTPATPATPVTPLSPSVKEDDTNSSSNNNVNIISPVNNINNEKNNNNTDNKKTKGKEKEVDNLEIINSNSSLESKKIALNGLNDESLYYEAVTKSAVEREPNKIYLEIGGKNYKLREKKSDTMTNLFRAVDNIRSEMQYKRNTRARYNSIAIMIIVFGVVLVSIIIGIVFAGTTEEDYTLDKDEGIFSKTKPAICQWRGDDITINEFAVLSCACYYKTMDDIKYSWLYGRPDTSTNEFVIGDNNIEQSSGVQYVDFINNSTNTIVVAVRGTYTIEDIFQDIYIWSASALLELSGYFGTFISFWPRETIAGLVNFIVKQFTNFQLLYWVGVENHIKNLQLANPTSKIYITGHSLGGGIAGVISAHLNLPAITFSSPGLGYSYKTYDIELKKLYSNFVNVIPMSDPVPYLDSQVGQIQHIDCNTKQPLSCHSIYNTIDTLNEMCREKSVYRYWDHSIEEKINGEDIPHKIYYKK